MVTAKLAGLEPEVWWSAIRGGAADSFVMQHDVRSIFAGHYDPSSSNPFERLPLAGSSLLGAAATNMPIGTGRAVSCPRPMSGLESARRFERTSKLGRD